MSLGKQLKNQLEMRKTTVKDFAKEIGVPPTTLYSFINRDSESGKSDLIFKICQGLDMSLSDFLDISLSDFANVEVDINFNDPYSIALKKLRNKESLTTEELLLIQDALSKLEKEQEEEIESTVSTMVKFNLNDSYNIALKKLKNKEPLTDEEIELIQNTWNSESFKQQIAKLPEKVDELSKRLKANYDLLNEKGKEKALEQVELLTKIPEYRKDNK